MLLYEVSHFSIWNEKKSQLFEYSKYLVEKYVSRGDEAKTNHWGWGALTVALLCFVCRLLLLGTVCTCRKFQKKNCEAEISFLQVRPLNVYPLWSQKMVFLVTSCIVWTSTSHEKNKLKQTFENSISRPVSKNNFKTLYIFFAYVSDY